VARKPIVQYVVEELVRNGIEQILFVTARNKSSIENHFDHDPELVRTLTEANKQDLLGELGFESCRRIFSTRAAAAKGLRRRILCGESFAGESRFAAAAACRKNAPAAPRSLIPRADLCLFLGERANQLRVVIEMILDGGLVAARDEQDLFDAVSNQLLTTYCTIGFRATGSISLGCDLVPAADACPPRRPGRLRF